MLNQFSRTELLLGHDNMEKLKNARVAVFGIGGVGGFTVEALARSGVGTLDLIDDDRVCLTNINRQIIATRKTIGQYKVDAAKERILDINPDAVVNTYKTFFMPDTADAFDFSVYDYVVDAIDTVTGKIMLVEAAQKAGLPADALPKIHISGCPSSCGTHQTGVMGFRGAAKKVNGKAESAFLLFLNGCDIQGKEKMGEELGTILESQIPDFLISLGKAVAAAGVSFAEWNARNPQGVKEIAAPFIAADQAG